MDKRLSQPRKHCTALSRAKQGTLASDWTTWSCFADHATKSATWLLSLTTDSRQLKPSTTRLALQLSELRQPWYTECLQLSATGLCSKRRQLNLVEASMLRVQELAGHVPPCHSDPEPNRLTEVTHSSCHSTVKGAMRVGSNVRSDEGHKGSALKQSKTCLLKGLCCPQAQRACWPPPRKLPTKRA